MQPLQLVGFVLFPWGVNLPHKVSNSAKHSFEKGFGRTGGVGAGVGGVGGDGGDGTSGCQHERQSSGCSGRSLKHDVP